MIPVFVWYALFGASVREAWGIWKAYETFIDVKLARKRIVVTWAFAWFFGIVGGEILAAFDILPLGISLVAFFCGILSGNSISYFAKRMGFSQKLEVPVSEQQLETDLSPRQVNAVQAAEKTGKITRRAHAKINAITKDAARRDLEKLVTQGKLVRLGRGKATYYVPPRYASNARQENTRHSMTRN